MSKKEKKKIKNFDKIKEGLANRSYKTRERREKEEAAVSGRRYSVKKVRLVVHAESVQLDRVREKAAVWATRVSELMSISL